MSRPTYEELEAEIAVLRRQLHATTPLEIRMQQALRLTPREGRVLHQLLDRGQVSRDAIYSRCFEYDNGDGPEIKIVDVYICKLRRKLSDAGVPGGILNVRSFGYELTAATADYLRSAFVRAPEEGIAA